jgi:putative acetyltransferase
MNFNIRRAIHDDAQAIIDSHVRSIREICSKDYSPEQIEAWAGKNFKSNLWHQSIDRDLVWSVVVGSKVSGFGHLAVMSEGVGEVMGLYFAPEARGLGAGKKLFQIIKEEAKQNGVKELHLHATITAKSFYEQCGFIQIEESSIGMRGVQIQCTLMKCFIA